MELISEAKKINSVGSDIDVYFNYYCVYTKEGNEISFDNLNDGQMKVHIKE